MPADLRPKQARRADWRCGAFDLDNFSQGDVNGDAKADFSIEIVDPDHALVLTGAGDFVL
jgi:hypothetical protein